MPRWADVGGHGLYSVCIRVLARYVVELTFQSGDVRVLDLEPFLVSHTHQGEFRHEMGLSDEIKLVGIVGRIFPIKNHALFLESAAQISALEPTARFVIVGDGVLRPALEQQARRLGIAE